jgi:beta-1,4-mannosyl-glycoprotein beta-1,4-N-acetylglucosaminyltransferase
MFNLIQSKTNPKKILDAFLFYNELDLLKVRLSYLGEHVDQFIITEANVDFAGKPKPFLLNNELIKSLPFHEKIIYHREYIDFESFFWKIKRIRYRNKKRKYLWKIQDAQRNSLLKVLKKFSGEDIVIFSDIDEFPSIEAIQQAVNAINAKTPGTNKSTLSLQQVFFYFNIYSSASDEIWHGSIVTLNNVLCRLKPHKLRARRNDFPHIEYGGWHFSYFMSEEKIIEKVNAISDAEELSQFKGLSVDEVRFKVINKLDLYDRGILFKNNKVSHDIPATLTQLIKKHLPMCA